MQFIGLIILPLTLIIIYKIAQSLIPAKSIEYTIITSLIAVIIYLGKMVFTLKANEGSFKSQIDSLKNENSKFESKSQIEIDQLKKENISLQQQIYKHTDKQSLLSNYGHNDKTGVSKHRTSGQLVCTKCLLENSLESPLTTKSDGWICPVCNKYYGNPNYNLPRQSSTDYDPLS